MSQEQKFLEMARVRVVDPKQPSAEGYVIKAIPEGSKWLYKVSLPDPDEPGKTYDNWYAEDALERC